jgi:hypothetical protein
MLLQTGLSMQRGNNQYTKKQPQVVTAYEI